MGQVTGPLMSDQQEIHQALNFLIFRHENIDRRTVNNISRKWVPASDAPIYRQPCVATVADYVLLRFIYFLFIFYSTLVLRNYSTDSHKILRNCVFWCSLNNPVVFKFFWRHLAEKNAKNSKNLVKISRVDSDFWQ